VLASTAPLIYTLAAILVVTAIVLVGVGAWLIRTTRSDHAALGPLEAMGERGYRHGDDAHRTALIDRARPAGAEPLAATAIVAAGAVAGAPPDGPLPAPSVVDSPAVPAPAEPTTQDLRPDPGE
jgi:hypothetical protein